MYYFIALILFILSLLFLWLAFKSFLLYSKDYEKIYTKIFALLQWEVTMFFPLGMLLLLSAIAYLTGDDIFGLFK